MAKNPLFPHARTKVFLKYLFFLGLLCAFGLPTALAANGDVTITVTTQLGASLSGASVTINCNGAAATVTDGSGSDGDGTSNGTIVLSSGGATLTTASCLTNGEAITQLDVAKDGYVTTAATGDLTYNTGASNDNTASLNFGHKIVVKDELGNNLTPTSVTAGASNVSCTISTNNAYCPVVLADDNTLTNGFVIVKDGYVTTTANLASNRTAGTDAQAVVTLASGPTGVKFSHKIVVTDELGTALTPTSVTAGASNVSCTISTNNAYCPVVLADDNTLTNGFVIIKDGYVTQTTNLASNRTVGTNAQAVVTLASGPTGVKFSHKIVVTDELGAALTPTTVTAGASNVSCTISTNNVYCPVVLADDNTLTNGFVIIKDGYVTQTTNLASNRTAGTDAQAAVTLDASTGVKFSHKIVVVNELGSNLTPDNVVAGAADTVCTLSNNVAYCPVTLADDNSSTATVTKDGYVTVIPDLASNRTAGTDAQGVVTLLAGTGLKFGHKVTVENGNNHDPISGAVVTVGGTTCSEDGSTGAYYCATPLASDGGIGDVLVSASGYDNGSANSFDRTAGTDVQRINAISIDLTGSNVVVHHGGGGGGGVGTSSTPTISSTPSDQEITYNQTVDVPSSGTIFSPVLIKNTQTGASLSIQKDTIITGADGKPYGGTISLPAIVLEKDLPTPLPQTMTYDNAIVITTVGGASFSKDFTVTIPLMAGKNPKVYYYDESTKTYKMAGDGGTVSADGKFIMVNANHLTATFVVVKDKEDVTAQNPPPTTSDNSGNAMQTPFTDIDGHWAATYIAKLYEMKVVQGRTATTYEPDATLTRGELLKIAELTFGITPEEGLTTSFKDESKDAWHYIYVTTAEKHGIISGYEDGTVRADAPVSRAEALKILLVASGKTHEGDQLKDITFEDVMKTDWFYNYVQQGYSKGIVSGKSSTMFAPNDNITRAEMAKMAVELYNL